MSVMYYLHLHIEQMDLTNFPILQLPDLAIQKLVEFLDFNSLRKLRLVCQKTKSWIDQPSVLKRLPVCIKNERTLQEVLLSKIPWNNFTIFLAGFAAANSSNTIIGVLTFRFHGMKYLKIHTGNDKEDGSWQRPCSYSNFKKPETPDSIVYMIVMLFRVVRLESLHIISEYTKFSIGHMNRVNYLFQFLQHLSINDMSSQNMSELKYLRFDLKNWSHEAMQLATKLLLAFLGNSPNLKMLKMPFGLDAGTDSIAPPLRYHFIRPDCEPLLEYLKNISETNPPFNMKMRIDFSLWSPSGIPIYPFELTPHTFLEVVKYCKKIGCKLENVPSRMMPFDSRKLTEPDKSDCSNCISSIHSINTKDRHLEKIFIPPNCPIKVSITTNRGDDYSDFHLPESLNVTFISLNWGTLAEMLNQTGALVVHTNIFIPQRPSLEEFRLAAGAQYDTPFLYLPFPNLKKLHASNLGMDQVDILTRNHNHLENLTLNNCTLFDMNFLGDNQFHMRNLVHLKIKFCSLQGLTDFCFRMLFKNLKLKTFKFVMNKNNCNITKCPVTFRHGYSALAEDVEGGGFKNSIETIVWSLPSDSTPELMMRFLQTSFPNLKRFRVVGKELETSSGFTQPPVNQNDDESDDHWNA